MRARLRARTRGGIISVQTRDRHGRWVVAGRVRPDGRHVWRSDAVTGTGPVVGLASTKAGAIELVLQMRGVA